MRHVWTKEIDGKEVVVLDMGEVTFPSGEILVRDPLVWLRRNEKPYLETVPKGTFPLKTLVVKIEEDHYWYVATRVQFTDKLPVVYYEALTGTENSDSVEEDSYFGFSVDAGLATIVMLRLKMPTVILKKNGIKKIPRKTSMMISSRKFLLKMP